VPRAHSQCSGHEWVRGQDNSHVIWLVVLVPQHDRAGKAKGIEAELSIQRKHLVRLRGAK